MSTQADPFSPVLDVFHRLNAAAINLAAAYAEVNRLLKEHEALIAEAARLSGAVNAQQVIDMIANHYQVKPSDMVARSCRRRCVEPRQVAMWVLRRITLLSAIEVGLLFDRCADTVFLSDRTVENDRESNPSFRAETDMLLQKARGSMSALAFKRAMEVAP